MEVGRCAGAKHLDKSDHFFSQSVYPSNDQVSYCFAPQTKAIFFQPIGCSTVMRSLYISSFLIGTMPPAVVFIEQDSEIQQFRQRDDWPTGGENWDEELLVPGRMVYVGQGQTQFVRIDEPDPGMMFPKRRHKKKKRTSPQLPSPPPPAPVSPAPIDWSDWEELCQFSPPPPPTPPVPAEIWEPEDWDAEIAASQWEPEDWDAEIAASQWQPEDWDAEIAASQ